MSNFGVTTIVCILTIVSILVTLSFLSLFSGEIANNDTTAKSPSLHLQRSNYGYHRPQPPYAAIQHTSHTCVVHRNTSSERVIHLPTAVPHLILIGAQKSATSEFQVLADKYINVITPLSAGRFEPHFFDFKVQGRLKKYVREGNVIESEKFDDEVCLFREKYTEFFNMSQVNNNTMSVVMEKTPSYMLHHNLPFIIDALCPWEPKILTILRDPVDRAWSHFRMVIPWKKWVNKNISLFETMVKGEIDSFILNGLLDNATTSLDDFKASLASTSDVSTSPFVFPNLTLEKSSQIIQNYKGDKKGFLIRGLYAPILLPWVKQFAAHDRLMVMKFKEVWNASNVDEVLRFAGVEDTSIDEHYDDFIRNRQGKIIRKANKNATGDRHANKGVQVPLDPTIRLYLKLFYQPFNRFLAQLLGEEWEGWGE